MSAISTLLFHSLGVEKDWFIKKRILGPGNAKVWKAEEIPSKSFGSQSRDKAAEVSILWAVNIIFNILGHFRVSDIPTHPQCGDLMI